MLSSAVSSLMLMKLGVNYGFSARNCMLNSPAVFRRQEFLIRCLGGYSDQGQGYQKRMEQVKPIGGTTLEADADNILRAIIPSLDPRKHKGQAGKLMKWHLYNLQCIYPHI